MPQLAGNDVADDQNASSEADCSVRILVDVKYVSNGVPKDDITEMVKRFIERAIGNGALTGDSPVEVDEYALSVKSVSPEAQAIDEEVVGDWLLARVESGNLNPEEMITMMARYALAEPDAMREEFAERIAQAQGTDEASELMEPAIAAKVWSDDHNMEAEFNAAGWFAKANDEEVITLADTGWRGDSVSDSVAEHASAHGSEVRAVFDYVGSLPKKLDIGFECEVDEDNAMAWLAQHRPGLHARLLCDRFEVRLVEAQEEEILGRWDWLDGQGNASDSSHETVEQAALDAVKVLGLASRARH